MMTLLEEEKGEVGIEGDGEEVAKGKEREGGEGRRGESATHIRLFPSINICNAHQKILIVFVESAFLLNLFRYPICS